MPTSLPRTSIHQNCETSRTTACNNHIIPCKFRNGIPFPALETPSTPVEESPAPCMHLVLKDVWMFDENDFSLKGSRTRNMDKSAPPMIGQMAWPSRASVGACFFLFRFLRCPCAHASCGLGGPNDSFADAILVRFLCEVYVAPSCFYMKV